MKLRNKKTGEILDSEYQMLIRVNTKSEEKYIYASTLTELNEEWEDYHPKEPLIIHEKVRKAVRAWFSILPRLEDRRILYENGVLWVGVYQFDCGQYDVLNLWLKSGDYYTIEELCGEEE